MILQDSQWFFKIIKDYKRCLTILNNFNNLDDTILQKTFFSLEKKSLCRKMHTRQNNHFLTFSFFSGKGLFISHEVSHLRTKKLIRKQYFQTYIFYSVLIFQKVRDFFSTWSLTLTW